MSLTTRPRNKIAEVEPLLDKIVLQNDQILLWQQRQQVVLNDGTNSGDDIGISKIIQRLEGVQQKCAEEVSRIDYRGTVRARMLYNYVQTLATPHLPKDLQDLIRNRMIIMGLLPVYRLRTPSQTKLITSMLGKLPTSGRDYSQYNW